MRVQQEKNANTRFLVGGKEEKGRFSLLLLIKIILSSRSLLRRGISTLHMENIVTSSRIIMKKDEYEVGRFVDAS